MWREQSRELTPADLARLLTVALTDARIVVSRAAIERVADRLAELLNEPGDTSSEGTA